MTAKSFKTYVNTPLTYKIQKPRHWYIEKNITPTDDITINETVVPYDKCEYNTNASTVSLPKQKIWNNKVYDGRDVCLLKDNQQYLDLDFFNYAGYINCDDLKLNQFSTNSYVMTKEPFDPKGKPWRFKCKFTTGSDVSTNQTIFHSCLGTGYGGRYGIGLKFSSSGFNFFTSSSGNSWLFDSYGTHSVQPNTTYWVEGKYDGTKYIFSYSLDNIEYIEDVVGNVSTPTYSPLVSSYFGIYSTSSFSDPFLGEIDFTETYFEIDGEIIWNGKKDIEYITAKPAPNYSIVGTLTNDNNIISGFSVSNYATVPGKIPSFNSFEFTSRVKINSSLNADSPIANHASEIKDIYISKDRKLALWDGKSYFGGTTVLNTDTWYWVKLISLDGNNFTGYLLRDNNYTQSTLPNIEQWSLEFNTTSNIWTNNAIIIGAGTTSNNQFFNGFIDMNNTNIKINGDYFWNPQQSKSYDIIGSVSVDPDTKIASGFNSKSYIYINKFIDIYEGYWSYETRFKINTLGKYQFWFYQPFAYGMDSSNKIHIWVFDKEITSTKTLSANVWYDTKFEFTGTQLILYYKPVSDTDWTETIVTDCSLIEATPNYGIEDFKPRIGINPNNTNEYFFGEIDLNYTKIKIDYITVWDINTIINQPIKVVGCLTDDAAYEDRSFNAFINNDKLVLSNLSEDKPNYDWIGNITIPNNIYSYSKIYKRNYQEYEYCKYTLDNNDLWVSLSDYSSLFFYNYKFDLEYKEGTNYTYSFITRVKTGSNFDRIRVLIYLNRNLSWIGTDTSGKLYMHGGLTVETPMTTTTDYWIKISETFNPDDNTYTHKIMYIEGRSRFYLAGLPDDSEWVSAESTDTTCWFEPGERPVRIGDHTKTSGYSWNGSICLNNTEFALDGDIKWSAVTLCKLVDLNIGPSIPGGGTITPIVPITPYYAYTPEDNTFLTIVNSDNGNTWDTSTFYTLSTDIGSQKILYMMNEDKSEVLAITNLKLEITNSANTVYPFTDGDIFFTPTAITTATRAADKDTSASIEPDYEYIYIGRSTAS